MAKRGGRASSGARAYPKKKMTLAAVE